MSHRSSSNDGIAGWALVNKDGEMESSDDGSMVSGSSEEVVTFEPDQVSYRHLHKDRSVSVESEGQSQAENKEGINNVNTSSASPDAVVMETPSSAGVMETPPSADDVHNNLSHHLLLDDSTLCTTIEKSTENDALLLDKIEADIDIVDGLATDPEEPSILDQAAGPDVRLLDSTLQRSLETSMTDSDCDFIRLEPGCIEEDDQSAADEPSSRNEMSSSSVSSNFNFLVDDDAAMPVEPHSDLKTDHTENLCIGNKSTQKSDGELPGNAATTSSTFEDEYQKRLFFLIKMSIVLTTVVIIGITGHFIGLYFNNSCGNIFLPRYRTESTCIEDLSELQKTMMTRDAMYDSLLDKHAMMDNLMAKKVINDSLMDKGARYDSLERVNIELLNEINQLNIMVEDLQVNVAKFRYQLSCEMLTLHRKKLEDTLKDRLNELAVENFELRNEIGQLRYGVPSMIQSQPAGDDSKLIGHKYCDEEKQKDDNQQIYNLSKALNASRNQSEMWQKLYLTEHAQRMNTSQHNATMDFFTCVTVLAPIFNVSGFLKYLNYTAIRNVTQSIVETLRGYQHLRKSADTMASHAENITADLYEDLQHVISEAESLFSDVHATTGDIYANVKDVVSEATSTIKRFFSSDVPERKPTKEDSQTKQNFKMNEAETSRGMDDNTMPDERKSDYEEKGHKNDGERKGEKRESVWRNGVKTILRNTKESVSRLGDHIEDAWDTMLSVSHNFWHKNSKVLVKFQDKVSRNINKFRKKITEKIHEKASKLFSKQTREERKKQTEAEHDKNKRSNNKDGQREEDDQSHGHRVPRHRHNNNREWTRQDDSGDNRHDRMSIESSVRNAAWENKSGEKESADWYFKHKPETDEPSGQWYFKHKTATDEVSGEWYFKHKTAADVLSGQWYFKHKDASHQPSGQWYFKHKPAADVPSGQWYFKKSRDYHENYMDDSQSGENRRDEAEDTWYIQQMEHRRQYHENYMHKTRNGNWYFKSQKENGEPRYNQQTEYRNNKETKGEPTDSDDWLFARAESRQFKRELPGDD